MTKDGLPGEASQEGQSRPVSLAGLVLVLCVALMGVMGVSITLPILPKLGAVFHQDAAGVALLITCFTLQIVPIVYMSSMSGSSTSESNWLARNIFSPFIMLSSKLSIEFNLPISNDCNIHGEIDIPLSGIIGISIVSLYIITLLSFTSLFSIILSFNFLLNLHNLG